RRAAIESAVRTGQPAASALLRLGQPTGSNRTYPGFIVFAPLVDAPVQRDSAEPPHDPIGMLFVAFRVEDLFNAALCKAPLLPVNVEIYDGAIDPEKLLFRSEGKPDDVLGDMLAVTRQTKVAGRTWYLQFRPTSAFSAPTSSATPILIGIGGLLLAAAVAL